jgi:RHH-type transcriptional regulator, rel operon repressor / antitoxin RelB
VVRQAVESYLDDFEDVAAASHALQDPADPVLDWDSVRRDLLGQNGGERGRTRGDVRAGR